MPKVVDHDVRRAELVAATWSVIAEEGLEAATVRRIAEAAGCTTGRVTHYFASKEEVLVAALRSVHLAAAERMLPHVQSGGIQGLRAVLQEALPLDEPRRLEWRVWLAFWGRAASNVDLRAEQERRYAEWRGLLGELVRDAAPERSASERRTAVDVIAAAIDGLGIHAVLEPGAFSPRRLRRSIDTLLTAMVSG